MVSSTCYDLKQVRKDLSRFIEEIGYNPLLSEFDYFPIDPDLDTVENCRRRVEQDADIMVLIIGGRYGYVEPKSDKSITNLEYLTARAKGIPVYAFVDKGILPLVPMWERNPTADFGDTVPNTKVFEFIKQVRGKDSVWTIEFEHAQDIVQALKRQLAHQMLEGLNLRKQIRAHQSEIPADISGKAIKLILEKPSYWEYRLFAQVLTDEISKHENAYRAYKLGIVYGYDEQVDINNIFDWTIRKSDERLRLLTVVTDLLNKHIQEALAPPGTPADVKALVFVAQQIAAIYRESIDWSLRIKRVHTESEFQPILTSLYSSIDGIIVGVSTFGPEVMRSIDNALLQPKETREVIITLKINDVTFDGFVDVVRDCVYAYRNRDK